MSGVEEPPPAPSCEEGVIPISVKINILTLNNSDSSCLDEHSARRILGLQRPILTPMGVIPSPRRGGVARKQPLGVR